MTKKVIASAIIAIIILIILAFSLHITKKTSELEKPMIARGHYVAAEGKIEVIDGYQAEVGSELDGRIAEFYVAEGDEIQKGGLIAKLDDTHYKAKLNEAKAELDVSKSKLKEVASGAREEEIKRADAVLESAFANMEFARESLERHKLLFTEGYVTKELLDEKEKSFKIAAARLREAKEEKALLEKGPKKETIKNLEDAAKRAKASVEYYQEVLNKCYILAPVSGIVIRKYLHKGEIVSKEMNTPLVAVADVKKLWINAEIDETDIGRIKVGHPVEIRSYAYPEKVFKGEVYRISNYVGGRRFTPNNPAKNLDMKVIQLKILFEDVDYFKPGMTVDVRIMPKDDA